MTRKPKTETIRHTCTECGKWTSVTIGQMNTWDHIVWWSRHIPRLAAARYQQRRRNPDGCRGGGLHPQFCRCGHGDPAFYLGRKR